MLRFGVVLLAFAAQAFPADLEIRYSALERMVAAQMFTQEGRRYVRGNQAAKCQYAYLEAPKLSAAGRPSSGDRALQRPFRDGSVQPLRRHGRFLRSHHHRRSRAAQRRHRVSGHPGQHAPRIPTTSAASAPP